ncbi:metal-dependent hydrolase [Haloferax namakaokahaiae]|uniref:Metal-dependent hydrolase n=1 Tax=Haloferax namakaokahaiae TaxID=1748331 RepID=A0ABD5ZGB9_9EURY
MKSLEHAAVGLAVGAAAALVLTPPGGLAALVVLAVLVSVFIDLDHFVLARFERGDWSNLRLAVTNPRVGLLEQEKVFEGFPRNFDLKRLLSHQLIGGVAVAGLVLAGNVLLAAFVGVVVYAHIVCDLLRDSGIA